MSVVYNEQQQMAIEAAARKVAVVAGPGSGKTQTIAGKISRMPAELLPGVAALTFTNAAAAELKERIGVEVGFIGTLHGWCFQFLRRNGHLIGLPSNFSVINQYDADSVMDEVIIESRGNVTKSAVSAMIQWPWLVKGNLDGESPTERVSALYMSRLWAGGRIDYNGLLQLTLMILMDYKGKVAIPSHLIVDEAQDSAEIDWMIYKEIWTEQLFVVGDPDQSIYGFRGARPEMFVEWCLSADSLVKLETSYRCDQNIANVANRLMDKAMDRQVRKEIIPASKLKGVARFNSLQLEDSVEPMVLDWARSRAPEESWAILCRSNAEVTAIRSLLINKGIELDPEREREAAPRLVTYLDAIANPKSDIAFRALMRTFKRNVQPHMRDRLLIKARLSDAPYEQSLLEHFPEGAAFPAIREKPMDIASWKPVLESERFVELKLIPTILKEVPFGSSIQEIAMAASDRMEQPEHAKRTVRTIHKAKGLEWDAVLIPSLNEGNLPGPRVEDEEEHRRLLFVAITRARHKLSCIYDYHNPSRFLAAIGLL